MLGRRTMPGAQWFPGAELNHAAHALRGPGTAGTDVAVVAHSQTRAPVELSWDELRDQVARARAGLARLGVGRGDRVVAYLPNIPETLVAFLATASLGAVWASCAPEFGPRSVVDRFAQIEPAVLLAVPGYTYGDKPVDRREEVAAVSARACRRCGTSSPCRTARDRCPARRRGTSCWPVTPTRGSTRSRSRTPPTSCSPPGRPGGRRRSSTRTAASPSST